MPARFGLCRLAHQLRGDREAARRAFGAARVRLDAAIKEFPEDGRLHAGRGMVLTGLGRGDEAREAARWLQQSVIYQEDALEWIRMAEDRARILAQFGDADAALDAIERLLAGPSSLSVTRSGSTGAGIRSASTPGSRRSW